MAVVVVVVDCDDTTPVSSLVVVYVNAKCDVLVG